MKMAGISSKAYSSIKNPYQYQGDYSDFNEETGWNDFALRSYDAQIGRFIQVDPYDEFPSPYTGMGNNPVSNVDPDGGCIFCETVKRALTLPEIVITGTAKAGNAFQPLLSTAGTAANFLIIKEVATRIQPFPWPKTSRTDYDNLVNNQALLRDRMATGAPLIQPDDPDHYVDDFAHLRRSYQAEQDWRQMNYSLIEFSSLWLPVPKLGMLRWMRFGGAAKGGTNTIYRVVSNGEAADVLANGFRQAPISSKIASYEGKLFWTNMKDAKWYHNWVGEGNQILKIKVNKGFIFENGADAGKQFYYVSPDRLNQFNSAIKSIR